MCIEYIEVKNNSTVKEKFDENAAQGFPANGTKDLSIGAKLVGLTSNPAEDQSVTAIREVAAKFIDLLGKYDDSYESWNSQHCNELAVDAILTAQMFAVKAATFKS